MILVIVSVVIIVAVFILSARLRRLRMYSKARSYGQKGLLSKTAWRPVSYYSSGMPMRMAITEVVTKRPYMVNFKVSVERFVSIALLADTSLDGEKVQEALNVLYIDPSNLTLEVGDDKEAYMVQSAILYGLLCTQEKGANIQKRLMRSENHAGNDMYAQQKTDKEYFEYMNNHYANFCRVVSIVEPKKSIQIETVAAYLILDQ